MKKIHDIRKSEYYEIRSMHDDHGLPGQFRSEEEALDEINRSYVNAKLLGYDNRDNEWTIVLVRRSKSFRMNGDFISEIVERHQINVVEFGSDKDKYVLVY